MQIVVKCLNKKMDHWDRELMSREQKVAFECHGYKYSWYDMCLNPKTSAYWEKIITSKVSSQLLYFRIDTCQVSDGRWIAHLSYQNETGGQCGPPQYTLDDSRLFDSERKAMLSVAPTIREKLSGHSDARKYLREVLRPKLVQMSIFDMLEEE